MISILYFVFGYLIGSVPFALVIGKLFYKKDIRQYGSGNLGASNAGRVLGKKAGLSVAVLDVLKCVIAIVLVTYLNNHFNLNGTAHFAGFGAIIGHCYPLFAQFKGGKAVSVTVGFILAANFYLFLIFIVSFLLILKLFKIVSAASIGGFIIASFASIFMGFSLEQVLILNAITIFVCIRHRTNLKRILEGNENKVTWI